MYFYSETQDNITYSLDMLRIKTYMTFSMFSELEFRFMTCWKDYVKDKYTSGDLRKFFYNYNIEISEGVSFWFGFLHNNEKRFEDKEIFNENKNKYVVENGFNFTLEFNPNKLKKNKIIQYILNLCNNWYIKSFDLAMDVKIGILDLIVDYSGRVEKKTISRGYDNKTVYIGKGNGRVKVYNKKRESNLNILGELTRIEMSVLCEDYDISRIAYFNIQKDLFPKIYTNRYIYTIKDYEDKTLLAVLYAVQAGFPVKDLTRSYKVKIKNLLEGGYQIKFDNKIVKSVVQQTIYKYFVNFDSNFIFM